MPAKAGTKPKRGFMDGYRHYDPAGRGYGSAEDWTRAAEALAEGFALPPHERAFREAEAEGGGFAAHQRAVERNRPGAKPRRIDPDLALLGLDEAPADAARFKAAFRAAAMAAHPDRGGSDEAMRAVLAAWERIKARYGRAAS